MADIDLSKLTGSPVFQYYDPSGPRAGDMFWSMATSREGCYIANGADYAQADEPELFAAIGTAFNTQINPTTGSAWAAPGAGRFRVPDMRAVVPRGAGTPHNGSALAVGAYEADQMQGHKHGINNQGAGGSNNRVSPSATGANPLFDLPGTETGSPVSDGGNGVPRIGSETRVKARGGNWFIRRFNPSPQVIGAGLATANTPGLTPPETPFLDLSAQLSSAQTGFNVSSCSIQAYSDRNGKWRIKGDFSAAITPVPSGFLAINVTLAGVTFPRTQSVSAMISSLTSPPVMARGYAAYGQTYFRLEMTAGSQCQGVYFNFDVEVSAKPTWA